MRNKSILKLVSRFVMIIVCSLLVLFVLNICLFIGVSFQGMASGGGWQATEELTAELQENGDGTYFVSERGKQILAERDAWAVLVQDGTGDVVWYSENLPAEIPLHYTAAQISADTLGYIEDYPTTTAARENDLLIMGHPKETYWKSMWNTYDLSLIKNLPRNDSDDLSCESAGSVSDLTHFPLRDRQIYPPVDPRDRSASRGTGLCPGERTVYGSGAFGQ